MLYDEYVVFDSEETEAYLKEQCKRFSISHITFDEGAVITKSTIDEFIDTLLEIRGIKENTKS